MPYILTCSPPFRVRAGMCVRAHACVLDCTLLFSSTAQITSHFPLPLSLTLDVLLDKLVY